MRLIVNAPILVLLVMLASCTSNISRVTPPDENLDKPTIAALPSLSELRNPASLKATSQILSVDGWEDVFYRTENTEQVGNSVRLNSSATEISATIIGIHITYDPSEPDKDVPYVCPYEVIVHTNNDGLFWFAKADYKANHWRISESVYSGTDVSIPVTLTDNAAEETGTFWCAIITYGGEQVTVNTIDFNYPDVPIFGQPLAYQQFVLADDGTRLATDVYLPYYKPGGFPPPPAPPFPVVLFRTPYPKSQIDAAIIRNLVVDLNVIVMTQYFRGRLTDSGDWPDSEGTETLFREHAGPDFTDAIDTVDWIEGRSFYNGDLILAGPSALGLWIYQAATQLGDRVAAIYPQVSSGNVATWAAQRNGCFKRSNVEGWLTANGFPAVLYDEAKANFNSSTYWDPLNFDAQASGTDCPGYHETGWFDVDVSSTINSWKQLNENGGPLAQGNQWLIVGPWSHDTVRGNVVGELTFPTTPDINNPTALPQEWDGLLWSVYMLGRNPLFTAPTKNAYVYFIGEEGSTTGLNNSWAALDNWPPPSTPNQMYFDAGSALSASVPAADDTLAFAFDPATPLDTLGGELLPGAALGAGPYDQAPLYASGQVGSFKTAPLGSATTIAGVIDVEIYFETDAVDTDVMVKLIDVYPGGDDRNILVCDSAMRLSHAIEGTIPGSVHKLNFSLGDRAWVFEAGHSIGIDVQCSNFPRFDINPGNGDPFLNAGGTNGVTQNNTLHFGPTYPSHVILPEYTP